MPSRLLRVGLWLGAASLAACDGKASLHDAGSTASVRRSLDDYKDLPDVQRILAEPPATRCNLNRPGPSGIYFEADGHTPLHGCRSAPEPRLRTAICRHEAKAPPTVRVRDLPPELGKAYADCLASFGQAPRRLDVGFEGEADSLRTPDGGLVALGSDLPEWEGTPNLPEKPPAGLGADALAIPWGARAADVLALPGVVTNSSAVFLPDAPLGGVLVHRRCDFTSNRLTTVHLWIADCDPGKAQEACPSAAAKLVASLGPGERREDGCVVKWDRNGSEIRIISQAQGRFVALGDRELAGTAAERQFKLVRARSATLCPGNQPVIPGWIIH